MKTIFKFFIPLAFFLLSSLLLQAQKGDLFIYNYKVPFKNIDNYNFSAVQGTNNLMYFANRKGILAYDGKNWEIINTKYTPYTLEVDKKVTKRVYVGCRNSFGYLKTNKKGEDFYVSISGKKKGFGAIKRIFMTSKYAYFYSDKALFKVSLKTNKIIKSWYSKEGFKFMGIGKRGYKIYLNILWKGIHVLKNDKFEFIERTEMYSGHYLKTSTRFNKQYALFGFANNWTYLFDGKAFRINVPEAKNYFLAHEIYKSMPFNQNTIAMATVSGGVAIIERKIFQAQTVTVINNQTGLPDDEVYAMTRDNQGGVWICHAKGISRADIKLPLRKYSDYAGLNDKNNIYSITVAKDTLFLATADGVFYLSKVIKGEDVKKFIKKEERYVKDKEIRDRLIKDPEPKRKFRTLRHSAGGLKTPKRSIEKKVISSDKEEVVKLKVTNTSELVKSVFSTDKAREEYALLSIPFVYRPVTGLNSKCRQLLNYKGRVIIVSNTGLYEAVKQGENSMRANVIIPDEYINFAYQSQTHPNQIYVATNKGLLVVQDIGGTWQVVDKNEEFGLPIRSVVEFKGDIWLGAESRVIRIPVDSLGKIGKQVVYSFKDTYSEDVIVRIINNEPTFILSSGIYRFNPLVKDIYLDKKLTNQHNSKSILLYNQEKYTWIKKDGYWKNLNQNKKNSLATRFLAVFNNIKDIYVDDKQNIWVIDDNKNIFKLDKSAQLNKKQKFDTFIRSILDKEDNLIPLDKIHYDYNEKTLSFTFKLASPFYRSERNIEYRYKLEGLNNKWSDWDTKAIIAFPYVPSGKYTLRVEARNIFGQKSVAKVYSFEIEPPFWETYWFYFLQIAILFGLLLLSFILSRRGKSSVISYLLTLIFIITLFEFLFLLAEPYVEDVASGIPALKLGMNIMLALSLAPIERILSYWMRGDTKRVKDDIDETPPTRASAESREDD